MEKFLNKHEGKILLGFGVLGLLLLLPIIYNPEPSTAAGRRHSLAQTRAAEFSLATPTPTITPVLENR